MSRVHVDPNQIWTQQRGSALMMGMRKQTALAVVATVAVLMLALLVSGADQVWFMNDSNQSDTNEPDASDPNNEQDRPNPNRSADVESDEEIGVWFDIIASVLLGALALALGAMLVRRTRARRRRRKPARDRGDVVRAPESALAESVEVPSALVDATDDLQVLLQQGTPRNAIVSCWVALEDACSRAGLARHPAETSVEFTSRVLSTFVLTETAIDDLAALYREARFSAHVLTEQDREAAVQALHEVQAQLRTRIRREAEAQS
jgi:hypothetical protein